MGKVKTTAKELLEQNRDLLNTLEQNMSKAYVLISIANTYIEDVETQLRPLGLEIKDVKFYHNKIKADFSRLLVVYKSMMKKDMMLQFSEETLAYWDCIEAFFEKMFMCDEKRAAAFIDGEEWQLVCHALAELRRKYAEEKREGKPTGIDYDAELEKIGRLQSALVEFGNTNKQILVSNENG